MNKTGLIAYSGIALLAAAAAIAGDDIHILRRVLR